jgi:hypothetical protein
MALNLNHGQKTIDLLRMLALPMGKGLWAVYEALCEKYGFKPVERKLEELDRRDYLEYGVTARSGWLTEKGKATLVAIDAKHGEFDYADPYEHGGQA